MFQMSNRTYDVLKKVVTVLLPASGTLYFTLAGIWGLPAVEQVVGSVAALNTFLGVVLGISNKQYQQGQTPDGDLIVAEDDGETYLSLGVNKKAVADLINKDEVRLQVVRTRVGTEQ